MIDKVTAVSKVKLGRVTCLRVPDPGQGQRHRHGVAAASDFLARREFLR
jgi:hypothetical protein